MANSSGDESPGDFTLELSDGSIRDKAVGFTGLATAHFANGDTYKGGYLDGQKHGEGVYTFSNGDTFEGVFEHGKKSGLGRMDYAEGGFFHGEALHQRCVWNFSVMYDVAAVFLEGCGGPNTVTLRGFNCEGYFKGNLRCGEGTRRYANGDVYYGQWLDGKRHGTGVYSFGTTKYKLKGTWANGSLVEGCWIWVDGTRFEGKFQLNKPSGFGSWIFPNGTCLKGVYSQRVMPLDDTPDDDPVPAQQVELKWTSTAA